MTLQELFSKTILFIIKQTYFLHKNKSDFTNNKNENNL